MVSEELMDKKIQLFCIPYAGGNSAVFHGIEMLLPETVELIPLEYAGHGRRSKEAFYPTFDEMTADVAHQIREKRDTECDYAVLGYSMGSIVTYELFAGGYLADDGLLRYVFLAAHESPDVFWDCKAYVELDDESFMEKMLALGGFSRYEPGYLRNRFFRKLYFNPMREDYRLLSDYRMKNHVQIPVPVTMFYASEDIPWERISRWSAFAGAGMEFAELGTNHFFLQSHEQEMAEVIVRALGGYTKK